MSLAFHAQPRTSRGPVRRAALVSLALLVGVLGGLGAAVLGAAPAAAHASLQSTDPEADQLLDVAPDVIRLVFDEPVEVALGGVDVIDPQGERLGGSAELADDGLEVNVPFDESGQGTYTVAWRVVSEDGHPISGSFVFHLGERTGAVAAETGTATSTRLTGAAGRWLALAGVLVSVGGLIFAVAVAGGDGTDPTVRRLRPLVAAAALLTAVGVVLATWAQVAEATGRGLGASLDLVGDAVADTRFGRIALWRAVAAIGLALTSAGLPIWRRHPPAPRSAGALAGGLATVVTAALATALIVLGSIAGHPWTTPAQSFAVVTDAIHVTVAATWTGGLVALLVMLRGAPSRRPLVRRFSTVALVAVVAVVASGLISAWLQLRTVAALWRTGYGRVLTAKVLVVAAMTGLGWANRRSIRRSPLHADGDATAAEGARVGTARRVRSLVAAEVALAAVVVALTAVLVNRPPGRDEASAPYSADRTTGDLVVQLTVDPAQTGANQLHLYFFETTGLPAAVDAVEVTARVGEVPPRVVPVEPVSPSHFSTYDASLTPGGRWQLDVTAVRRGQATTASFEVPIR